MTEKENIIFVPVTLQDRKKVQELSDLASEIVKEHYDPLLGSEQNDYMIQMFQSVPAITKQLEHGYQYDMVCLRNGTAIGFVGYYPKDRDEMYISKFYLHRDYRGKGISRKMLDFVIEECRKQGLCRITLNVNKYNDAILAYEKLGFTRLRSEVNDIGHGYVMDDYVYLYQIKDNGKGRVKCQ